MKKKIPKVCIITACRSEYGLLRWVIDEVHKSEDLQLQLVVTGSHLIEDQGSTYKCIEADGYPITAKVDMTIDSSDKDKIAKSMGECALGMSDVFTKLNPDIIVILGDRYELLPICSAALVMNIPVAHIAGGDVTEGAIDDKVRNAVTMMSTIHFPGTTSSADRVSRMLGSHKNVYVVGETNLDNFNRIPKLERETLAERLSIDPNKEWILCTYHPETLLSIEENLKRVKALSQLFIHNFNNCEIIITKSNADYGGQLINDFFEKIALKNVNVHQFSSLGQSVYINVLKQSKFMIGNSSSGIFESPFAGVPCIDIGNRQKGRIYSRNIVVSDGSYESLKVAASRIESTEFIDEMKEIDNPYGDGHSSERIVGILKKYLYA